jgi:glutathione S-transferase
MTKLHLISHHLCPYVQRAVIVLSEKNIAHERTYIDLANKPDWFRAMSPLGRVPVLETDAGVLFESQVIAEYLDEITLGSLHPNDVLEKARHRAWIEFGSETLAAIGGFYSAADAEGFEKQRRALRKKFERINKEISGSYFAGNAFYMIDGVWGTIFRYFDVFDQIGDFEIMTDLEAVQNWRKAVSKRPSVVAAPPEGYAERLEQFLRKKKSYLGGLASQNHEVARNK